MEVVDTYQSRFHLMVKRMTTFAQKLLPPALFHQWLLILSLRYLWPWWPAGWEHQLKRKLRSKRDSNNRGMRGMRGRGTLTFRQEFRLGGHLRYVLSARRSVKKLSGDCGWLKFKELNRVFRSSRLTCCIDWCDMLEIGAKQSYNHLGCWEAPIASISLRGSIIETKWEC